MNRKGRGFVVSAVLYPLLVLFLALMMGLLAMSDTRKRILDKMKLEISDSIFDDAECSCDTILNKLNYLIKNGVGGTNTALSLKLNIQEYETPADMPYQASINDISIFPLIPYSGDYSISAQKPTHPKEGMIWINFSHDYPFFLQIDTSKLPLGLCYQFVEGEWLPIQSYVRTEEGWKLYSGAYDDWRLLVYLTGTNPSTYSTLEDLLKDLQMMKKILNTQDYMQYLIDSPILLQEIKDSESYTSELVQLFLETTVITNIRKYELGFPCYLFYLGKTDFSISSMKYCSNSVQVHSTTVNVKETIDVSYIGATNCCGGSIAYFAEEIDFTKYNKLYFKTGNVTNTHSSGGIIGGYSKVKTNWYKEFNKVYLSANSTGFVNIHDITAKRFVGIGTTTCSNENNSSTGTSKSGSFSEIWLQ